MSKPLEFKIIETKTGYVMVFYYEDGTTEEVIIGSIPKGIELNRHYNITDLYGYTVIDDRKGL